MRSIVFAVLIVLTCSVNGQQNNRGNPPVASRKLEKVKQALTALDWAEAKSLAEKLVEQYPNWTESWKIYSQVFQDAGEISRSEVALHHLILLDSLGYPLAYRWLAEWMFQRGDYDSAAVNFDKFKSLIHDTSNFSYPVNKLNSSLKFALGQMKNNKSIMPDKLQGPVNTDNDEYFPSLSVDGSVLAFTRQSRLKSSNGKIPQEELLYCNWRDSVYENPISFPYPINTGGNEGTQSLSQDGRIMFFTACSRPDTKGGCDIYYCTKSGEQWSDPQNIGYPVNTRYWESTPFLAQDGKQLFFSSNRPGGYGGMDIWKSTLQSDQSWSNPQNLGPIINTPLDEMSPVLFLDGKTLFFASNGHAGMGGFDLFKCDLTNLSVPSSLENLGYGVNTFNDEDALTINSDTFIGLFASNRDPLTGKDIYQSDFKRYINISSTFTLTGIVRNSKTRLPVSARIEVQPHGEFLVSSVQSDPVTGKYLLGIAEKPSYRIGASSAGYLPYSKYFIKDSLVKVNRLNQPIDLEPIQTGASIVLQNTFFEVNSYVILPESVGDMNEILKVFAQNPGISIEISGFTDNTGTDEYNLVLSQKRAESVMQYLCQQGVNPGQLTAKGYGKTKPLASNDTEEGRQLNRRTEIKIISLK